MKIEHNLKSHENIQKILHKWIEKGKPYKYFHNNKPITWEEYCDLTFAAANKDKIRIT